MNLNHYQAFLDAFYNFAREKPETLVGVYESVIDECRDSIALQFASKSLWFYAQQDDDSITVEGKSSQHLDTSVHRRIDHEEPWKSLLGKEFGWGWTTLNQQGYCDGVLLSFEGIDPAVMLSVAGSSIRVSRIVPEGQRAPALSNGPQRP